ncbi:MAG TPA: nitroreductase/quinone reductase family protein [Roseiflexaceae bacterium]|jgi:deazaflavin-dependent oxidoreductase (nitroreductase family)|nr:nitroreductase/quinone reductase family protein [Roseiflexaceae bacterium]
MDQAITRALETGRTIDITTIGRESGQPRRIEIWFHTIDGHMYITGTPGRRDWYANMLANPAFTFHLKEGVTADLPAHARPITDPAEKRAVLQRILTNLERTSDLDKWVADSPLVEVLFDA